ncbi:MAG TPA: PQQ-binding-like beta-propeller repeat protein [Planctomycetaceae bacterium]|nr:PQQ-binding-like beta-propeller repeat protein [Planctomycetaceae bacterium]
MVLVAIAVASGSASSAEDWPHWRGLHRNDKVDEHSGWKDGAWKLAERWKINVGEGSTTPVVIGNRLYTMGWKDNRDTVICLDTENGKTFWSKGYPSPRYARNSEGDEGLYFGTTSSPEFDPESQFLYTLSCDGELICWDTTRQGETVWKMNLYDEYKMPKRPGNGERKNRHVRDYGYTTAPLVYKNWLIVEVGAPSGTVRAFDKKTGKSIWVSEYNNFAGHSGSPVVMSVEGTPCLLIFAQFELVAMRLDKGHEGETIGTYPWNSEYANNILTPTIAGEEVLISSFHSHERTSKPATCKLTVTLTGFRRDWEQPLGSHIGSPIIHKDRVYIAGPHLYCLDWRTGETVWEGENFNYGASCVLTQDERLIVLGNRGELLLAESAVHSPEKFTALASRKTLSGKDLWSHVVLANRKIYCKDVVGNLLCLEIE